MLRGSLWLCFAALCLSLTSAAKFDFEDAVLPILTQISRRQCMYSAADAPATSSPGNAKSFIKLSTSFSRETSPYNTELNRAEIQIVIFHYDQLENVKTSVSAGRFCCTTYIEDKGYYGCMVGNTSEPTYQPLTKIDVELPTDTSPVTVRRTYEIEKTGVHYLMFSSCQPEAGDVLIDGHNIWMNPYGYLPGEQYYNLPFFLTMIILYCLIIVIWAGLLFYYREEVVRVHVYIGAVLLMALLEVILWYVYFQYFNHEGNRSSALAIICALAATLKKTVSRLLVLAVCMGYGVVRPALASQRLMIAFGIIYCIFSFVLDIVKAHESQNREDLYTVAMLASLAVAILDFVFYLWTFMSLYDTVALLEERRQSIKLNLYRKFIWVLAACLVLSCAWVLYQVYYTSQYEVLFPTLWQTAWLFNAYWYVLSFVITVAIMVLWAPHSNSRQYAYYDQSASVEMDGMDQDHMGPGEEGNAARFEIEDDEEDAVEKFDDVPPAENNDLEKASVDPVDTL